MQILAIIVSLAIALVGVALFGKTIGHIVSVIKLGQPAPGRTDQPGQRSVTLAKETLLHTRMLQWSHIGVLHWFVAFGFLGLVLSLVTAFGQLFDAHYALPIIGHRFVFEWVSEFLTWTGLVSIIGLMAIRLRHLPSGSEGRYSRFFGSRAWQAYYVEYTIFGVLVCIVLLRGLEYALGAGSKFHFPSTWFVGDALFGGLSEHALENTVYLVAMIKILISFAWMITISLNATMGVAWHRFTAWPNIWFKRNPATSNGGGLSLGALQPIMVKGEPIDFENIDELDEDAALGVGKIEDFTWKGLLDFTTCTECGRCQSQCPAWNTDKSLSPKLIMMGLREHAYAKAPYLLASEDDRKSLSQLVLDEQEKPLVGPADVAVIDEEALWACTSCGACVQQCPVDIEHVDAIMDMRRYQVLIESSFPSELNGLFKGLENKGNPWNMSPSGRMDWAKDLPFEVKQVGTDVETLAEVEYLFWVGCAGAYEDRAKKTTQAVAELLNIAGVTFAVLGDGETCTGDPARRSGNEFVFQQLAMQNAEVFKETGAKKVVSTCAHCFNTLKNEYSQLGVELDVIHHTQLLNRLVREGKLTPVAPADSTLNGQKITYHDPCYLGRHNQVYDAPRELLDIIPGAEYAEMPRNKTKSFCCGAGGARMWMEEKIGSRINVNRTTEAVETGADKIATGCPFCRVMLSDGLTAKQADGSAREEVEVQDVAQLLLASVKRG